MSRTSRDAWGRLAEALAAWSLRLHGYRIVARRYRTPLGEIDLIVQRGRLVAFVEVKARGTLEQGLAALSLRQQQRTARAAEVFLMHHPNYAEHTLRFDLVAVRRWRWPRHLADAWRLD